MKRPNLDELSDKELINQFAAAAKEMGAAVLDSETRRANRTFGYMEEIDAVLRARGKASRLLLVPLLNDTDRFVRYYAAQYLLGVVPSRARAVIEWNAKYRFDAISGDAGMTLDNLDAGVYKPDQVGSRAVGIAAVICPGKIREEQVSVGLDALRLARVLK